MKDLIEKLQLLSEAKVQPGERKGISFKLNRLNKVKQQLDDYQNSLYHVGAGKAALPPELRKELEQIQEKLNVEVAKVEKAYASEYEKSMVNGRPVKMDNLFKALAKNCKEIIKVYKELNRNNFSREKFLFRGIKSGDDALYGKPFDARKPKDSDTALHNLVNTAIKTLGFDANRENAMFVSGDRGQASNYGSLFIMFPVDGFTFTWSQTVKDLVLDSSKKLEMMDKDVIGKIRAIVKKAKAENPEGFPISDPDDIFYSGYNFDRDKGNLLSAIESGKLPKEVKDLLDEVLTDTSIQKHFEFTDSDIFKAILSEKEIYIKGSYYAVNLDHKNELFKFLEQIDTDNVKLPENFGEVPEILDKGDVVRILAGDQEGKLGTITYGYSNDVEVFITQNISEVTVPRSDVELYKLPDGSIPVFEKGEEVIIVDPDNRNYGSVVKLNFVYPTGKVEYEDKNGNIHTAYKNQIAQYNSELEKELAKDLESKPPTIENNDLVVVSDPDNEFYKERGKVNYIYSTGKIEVRLLNKDEYIDFQPNQLTLVKNAGPELLSAEEGKFNLGDKVVVTDGEYKGYYATVDYLYSNTEKAEVDLIGMDKKVDVWLKDLQHYNQPDTKEKTTEPEPEPTQFKVGDKVTITAPSHNKGKTGTVDFVYTMYPEVSVELDNGEGTIDVNVSNVKKNESSEEKPKLKVGDKVKILVGDNKGEEAIVNYVSSVFPDEIDVKLIKNDNLKTVPTSGVELVVDEPNQQTSNGIKIGDTIQIINHESSYYGQVGEVIEVGQNENGKEWVKIKNAKLYGGVKTFVGWVEKVDGTQKPTETFKKNDKFKIKNKSYSVDGVIATVLDGPDNDGDYKAVTVDGKIVFTSPDQMEKLPEPSSVTKFTSGDTVKINGGWNTYKNGETGVIGAVYPEYGTVSVTFSDGSNATYIDSEIEKTEKDEPVDVNIDLGSDQEFNVGDYVSITDKSSGYYGDIGKIDSGPDIDGDYVVTFDERGTTGKWTYSQPNGMMKAPAVNLNKKAAPEPAPAAKFSEGDKVEVVSQFPSLIGKTGTVMQVSPAYEFVSVQLDGNTSPSSFPIAALKKIATPTQGETTAQTVADFKIGETIEVINDKLSTYGKTGKIVDINPMYLFVDWQGGGEAALKPTSVKKVTQQETAPTKLTVKDFEQGDKVEVTNPNSEYYKKQLVVTGKSASYIIAADPAYQSGGAAFKPNSLKKIG